MDASHSTSSGTGQTMSGNVGPALLIITWIFWVISFITVTMRVFTKYRFVQRRMLVDDWLMCCASLSQFINNILNTFAIKYGLGRHFDALTAHEQENALKYITIQEPFAVSSSAFGRCAFAIYLLHLIGPVAKTQKYVLYAIIAIQIILDIVVIVQIFAQCGTHVTALWDPAAAAVASCQSPLVETSIGYVQSALNSVCDAALTIVPLLLIKNLTMNTRTKLGLAALLCLSIFALTASLVKAVEIRNLSVRNNYTWNMAFLTLCVSIENNIVMIGASIPTLRPLLRWRKGSSSSSYNSGPYSSTGARGTTTPASQLNKMDTMTSRKSNFAMTDMRRDGSSEEIIFDGRGNHGHGSWGGHGGEKGEITRTVDVSVSYVESAGLEGQRPTAAAAIGL